MYKTLTALALTAFFSIASFTAQSQIMTCIDAVAVKNSTKNVGQGAYMINFKWTPGMTINVSFIGGTEWQRQKVRQYANLWSNYANLKFNWLTSGSGDIRISFRPELGSCSQIGTMAKTIPPGEWTMNYGWVVPQTPEDQLKGVVLHEFGHALGLLHEHMNPYSNIKWNKDKVYAYYMALGWSKDKIEQNVFQRYSVSQTNHKYDPKSIMHYPVPKEHTLDGYSIGMNNDLSPDDIKLIGELYPKNNNTTPVTTNRSVVWAQLQNVDVQHNVTENGKLGMRIKQKFSIHNAQSSNCIVGVYFYDAATDKPLKDQNGNYKSVTGDVATFKTFTPAHQDAQYNDLAVFMPYDELDLPNGDFRLKCFVALFDANQKQISTSGYQYFTYRTGITVRDLRSEFTWDNNSRYLYFYPMFTIDNAKDVNCNVGVFFYYENMQPVSDLNGTYRASDGTVATYGNFRPGYTSAAYNYMQRDLWVALPFSELHLPKGVYNLYYRVVLYDSKWNVLSAGQMMPFTFTQN